MKLVVKTIIVILRRVSDCEELVGILLGDCLTCEELSGDFTWRRWWGVYSVWVNLKRSSVPAGEVLEVQVIPSVEVNIVPLEPATVNVPFP